MIKEAPVVTEEHVKQAVAFHGHMCPGLAMGIRAAEVALREIGPHAQDEEVVAVVETDMCSVDAIQYLTGCTFGKGNLIHLDYGKNAYSFYRRSDGKAIRIVSRPDAIGPLSDEHKQLWAKLREKNMTDADKQRFWQLQNERAKLILEAPLEKLYDFKQPIGDTPRHARIHNSLDCAGCGEKVMETRARTFDGNTYCLPCFQKLDRRN